MSSLKSKGFIKVVILPAILSVSAFFGCGDDDNPADKGNPTIERGSQFNSDVTYGEFTDSRDGQTYRTVLMPDGKIWMAENLNYRDPSWSHNDVAVLVDIADKGSWCYNNYANACDIYGRLYTWNAAEEACPAGWHLPSYDEWGALVAAVGNSMTSGTKLKSSVGWRVCSDVAIGTNEYGFSALPGGIRGNTSGRFSDIGYYGYWWTNTESEYDTDSARALSIDCEYEFAIPGGHSKKNLGFAVRCVMDD